MDLSIRDASTDTNISTTYELGVGSELSQKLLDKEWINRCECYYVCHGNIKENEAVINMPIGRSTKDRKKMAVTAVNSKDAITHLKVLERYDDATLVELKLETGRTHQIRVHMQYIKHPLVGDPVYGYRKQNIKANGQMLHAYKITFVHPRTKKEMSFTCPIDEEFQRVLEIVRGK